MKNKPVDQKQKISLANRRMGLTLMSIALVFFIAIILKKTFLG